MDYISLWQISLKKLTIYNEHQFKNIVVTHMNNCSIFLAKIFYKKMTRQPTASCLFSAFLNSRHSVIARTLNTHFVTELVQRCITLRSKHAGIAYRLVSFFYNSRCFVSFFSFDQKIRNTVRDAAVKHISLYICISFRFTNGYHKIFKIQTSCNTCLPAI